MCLVSRDSPVMSEYVLNLIFMKEPLTITHPCFGDGQKVKKKKEGRKGVREGGREK